MPPTPADALIDPLGVVVELVTDVETALGCCRGGGRGEHCGARA